MTEALSIDETLARKIAGRLVPLLALVLLFNYLDKVNLSFAAVTMLKDLGFSNALFGAGAGAFAIGYALFAIPSTLMLHRLGARRWIGLIMILWGIFSAATAFVTRPSDLLAIRLLLGLAEAGFTPGIILYFSRWFPSRYRGRVLGFFLLIYPLSLVIGGPLSSALFSLNGVGGLHGWQWLFLLEGLPAVALAPVVFATLPDAPQQARWLSEHECTELQACLDSEQLEIQRERGDTSAWRALSSNRVWALVAVNFGLSTSGIGAFFFLPLIIQSMGFSVRHTGLLVTVPGLAATALLPLWGIWADRAGQRETVVAVACGTVAVGLLGAGPLLPSPWAIVPLSVAMVGFFGGVAAFWTLPTQVLAGAGAAIGIAFINVMGNLGIFSGPYLLGWLSDATGTFEVGLVSLALIATTTAVFIAVPWRRSSYVH